MKRALFGSVLVLFLAAASWAVAETGAKPAQVPPHEHDPMTCPMGGAMMGGGMMGGGMMGPMMMGGPGTKVTVKNIDKGVTITVTAADAATATRLQKMAEGMRLMHEAMIPEK